MVVNSKSYEQFAHSKIDSDILGSCPQNFNLRYRQAETDEDKLRVIIETISYFEHDVPTISKITYVRSPYILMVKDLFNRNPGFENNPGFEDIYIDAVCEHVRNLNPDKHLISAYMRLGGMLPDKVQKVLDTCFFYKVVLRTVGTYPSLPEGFVQPNVNLDEFGYIPTLVKVSTLLGFGTETFKGDKNTKGLFVHNPDFKRQLKKKIKSKVQTLSEEEFMSSAPYNYYRLEEQDLDLLDHGIFEYCLNTIRKYNPKKHGNISMNYLYLNVDHFVCIRTILKRHRDWIPEFIDVLNSKTENKYLLDDFIDYFAQKNDLTLYNTFTDADVDKKMEILLEIVENMHEIPSPYAISRVLNCFVKKLFEKASFDNPGSSGFFAEHPELLEIFRQSVFERVESLPENEFIDSYLCNAGTIADKNLKRACEDRVYRIFVNRMDKYPGVPFGNEFYDFAGFDSRMFLDIIPSNGKPKGIFVYNSDLETDFYRLSRDHILNLSENEIKGFSTKILPRLPVPMFEAFDEQIYNRIMDSFDPDSYKKFSLSAFVQGTIFSKQILFELGNRRLNQGFFARHPELIFELIDNCEGEGIEFNNKTWDVLNSYIPACKDNFLLYVYSRKLLKDYSEFFDGQKVLEIVDSFSKLPFILNIENEGLEDLTSDILSLKMSDIFDRNYTPYQEYKFSTVFAPTLFMDKYDKTGAGLCQITKWLNVGGRLIITLPVSLGLSEKFTQLLDSYGFDIKDSSYLLDYKDELNIRHKYNLNPSFELNCKVLVLEKIRELNSRVMKKLNKKSRDQFFMCSNEIEGLKEFASIFGIEYLPNIEVSKNLGSLIISHNPLKDDDFTPNIKLMFDSIERGSLQPCEGLYFIYHLIQYTLGRKPLNNHISDRSHSLSLKHRAICINALTKLKKMIIDPKVEKGPYSMSDTGYWIDFTRVLNKMYFKYMNNGSKINSNETRIEFFRLMADLTKQLLLGRCSHSQLRVLSAKSQPYKDFPIIDQKNDSNTKLVNQIEPNKQRIK